MKIFISYPSEKFREAERLSISLLEDNHKVFFDNTNLPKGESYDKLIREELRISNFLIFLVCPEAVDAGSYTLTELQLFQKKYPKPSGHVLPVMIAPTSFELIPNYIQAVTMLQPTGNFVAETTARIAEIASEKKKRLVKLLATAFGILAIAVVSYFIFFRTSKPPANDSDLQMVAVKSFSVFEKADQDSRIIRRVNTNEEFTLMPEKKVVNWARIKLVSGQEGWVMAQDMVFVKSKTKNIDVGRGFGFRGSYWQLYFTSPQPEGKPQNESGIDARFAQAIDRCKKSLQIAVYEINNGNITNAIIDAHKRGVKVQVVTDDISISFSNSTFKDLIQSGIIVKTDSLGGSSGIVHHKFAVLDDSIVWVGSWNYTDNSTFKNNENVIVIESPEIAAVYSRNFKKMYFDGIFRRNANYGIPGTTNQPTTSLPYGVEVFFTSDDDIMDVVKREISKAKKLIRFMYFAFTLKEIADLLNQKSLQGVKVSGIVEERLNRNRPQIFTDTIPNSEIRWDGNPNFLHHKCIIIDDKTIITGSLNLSKTALIKNSENVIILSDSVLASKFTAEFDRLWKVAVKREENNETDQ